MPFALKTLVLACRFWSLGLLRITLKSFGYGTKKIHQEANESYFGCYAERRGSSSSTGDDQGQRIYGAWSWKLKIRTRTRLHARSNNFNDIEIEERAGSSRTRMSSELWTRYTLRIESSIFIHTTSLSSICSWCMFATKLYPSIRETPTSSALHTAKQKF